MAAQQLPNGALLKSEVKMNCLYSMFRKLFALGFLVVVGSSAVLAETVSYEIDSAQSFYSLTNMIVNGMSMSPQSAASDIAYLKGQLNVDKTSTTIQFLPSNVACGETGNYFPGVGGAYNLRAPANFAYSFTAPDGRAGKLAYRGVALSLQSEAIPASSSFDASKLSLSFISGSIDMSIGVTGRRDTAVAGSSQNTQQGGTISISGNQETITVPIYISESYPTVYNVLAVGKIVAKRTLPPTLRSDFDANGEVNGADLIIWQRNVGRSSGASRATGDADGDNDVDSSDLAIFKTEFGRSVTPAMLPLGLFQVKTR